MTSQGGKSGPTLGEDALWGGRDTTRSPQIWLSHQRQQTLIATTLCADTQLFGHHTSTFDQRWHSPDLAKEVKHLDPGRGTIHLTTIPNVANSKVSVTKSLMSHIMYAAPVTSNVIRWDAHQSHLAERSRSRFIMCGAVRLRAVRIVSNKLFLHSERIRTVAQGVCIYIFALHSCAILSLLKYIKSCSQNSKMYTYCSWEPYSVHLKYYQCDGAFAI